MTSEFLHTLQVYYLWSIPVIFVFMLLLYGWEDAPESDYDMGMRMVRTFVIPVCYPLIGSLILLGLICYSIVWLGGFIHMLFSKR